MSPVIPLSELRQQIDAIDTQLLELINKRASLAVQVAKTKIANGETGSFYRPDREVLILRRIQDNNPGPLGDDTAVRFFRELMSACLALEKPLQVAFLGPEGTFSQQAAIKHFGHAAKVVPTVSIDEIFRAVENGHCHFGVVPVENSSEGVISNTLDRFAISSLLICGEVDIRVHHNLMGNVGSLQEITEVYSHQQSLGQCRRWLDVNLPGVKRTAVSSNAEAAKLASARPQTAAIAGEVAADLYALTVLERHIEDEPDNTTRFLVIGQQAAGSTGKDKTALMVSAGNRPGALHKVLGPFAQHGISMTRIESRPSRRGLWDYVFFIDIEGHRDDPEVAAALAELQESAKVMKILGSFPKAVL